MLGNFSEEAQFILLKAREEMASLNHPYIGSEHLVLAILNNDILLTDRLKDYGLTYDKFLEEIINIIGKGSKKNEFFLYTPLLKKIIENSILDAKDNNNGVVTTEHLFSALLEEGEGIAIRIFIGMDIDIDEMYDEFSSSLVKKVKKRNSKLLIDELGVDLTLKARENKLDPVISRDNEIRRLVEILSRRSKNNPILIGEAGVGKTAIVEGLARIISTSKVPVGLQNKRIISIDMSVVVSGTKYRGEFEERMQKLIKEVIDEDNIILFIDEIHTLVGAGGAEGAIDASNILKPYLARGDVRCIGATTTLEYKKFIESDKALDRRFQKVEVREPDYNQTVEILKGLRPLYESYHRVSISDDVIDKIVMLSNKYIYNRYQPDKAIDVLDEACAMVSINDNDDLGKIGSLKCELKEVIKNRKALILDNDIESAYEYRKRESEIKSLINELELKFKNNYSVLSDLDIARVIHQRTGILVYEIEKENIEVINGLGNKLKKEIIGQDKAIEVLVREAKKIRLGYQDNKLKSFLFVGPTGVGKTELAKLYASLISFDGELIRLDMSEYADGMSISKLIGSAPGYVGYNDNNVFDKIRSNPRAVILLDEVDKAHISVINLLYQILDEGVSTDAKGNKVVFNNNIIIMTSNALESDVKVGFASSFDDNVIDGLKRVFSSSFINRIDSIVVFDRLSSKEIGCIVRSKLENLREKYSDFVYDDDLIKKIVNECKYREFGARQVDKVISSLVEEKIIDNILDSDGGVDTLEECSVI